jgi:hypothetical protein
MSDVNQVSYADHEHAVRSQCLQKGVALEAEAFGDGLPLDVRHIFTSTAGTPWPVAEDVGDIASGAASEAPASIALITGVTTERKHVLSSSSRRASAEERALSRCSRIITGTLSEALCEGEVVNVFEGSINLGRAAVCGKAWMFCDARELRIGSALSYTVHVADRDGNCGPVSSIYLMTVGEPGSEG